MLNNGFSWEKFEATPVIGIIRGLSEASIMWVTELFVDVGFTNLEITMNTPGATSLIAALRKEYPDTNIGAGTVRTMEDLNQALLAGAQFIVTPIIDEAVIKHCVDNDVPIFPGAFTPSEIHKAWTLGASAIKVFPANDLGPSYIKNVLAPLNDIKLVPTGGINIDNIQVFLNAGVFGFGMGSSLFDKSMIKNEDRKALRGHFEKIKYLITEN